MHIIGSRATDLICEGALAIRLEATVDELISTIYSHPTVTETLREAALNFDKRAIHIHYFSCSNYVKDYRSTCLTRHYIRMDAVEAVVAMELRRLAEYLAADENRFAEILARKSNKQAEREKKTVQSELRKSEMRTLTKQVVTELIDHIEVYEAQGTNKTQRLVIYYKFVGYLDIDPTQCHLNYTADIREGAP